MVPALLIEMRQNQDFARAIPSLSGGLAREDDREDEDVVEDMLLLADDQSRGPYLDWENHEAQAWMISTMMGWFKADIQRVVGVFNRFIHAYGSKSGKSSHTKARIAEVLIEHVQSLQAYAEQIADARRAPRAIKINRLFNAKTRVKDEAVPPLVIVTEGGELAVALEALTQADKYLQG